MAQEQRGPTPRRVASVMSSIILVAGFVWYRAHRAGADNTVISSSKSAAVHRPDAAAATQPATTQADGDLVILPDSKVMRIVTSNDVGAATGTAPQPRNRWRIYGSKSAPVVEPQELLPQREAAVSTQPATTGPTTHFATEP